jgi:hypothetical protein
MVAHSAPAPDKAVRPTVSIEKLENLTIDAIAHRHEIDHRITQQLGGEHFLIAMRLGPANGSGTRRRAGAVFARPPPDRTPGRHFTRVFCINGASDEGIQINSGRHTQEIKIIGAGKIYNIFPHL